MQDKAISSLFPVVPMRFLDGDTIIENQEILMTESIQAEGNLVLKNCTIDTSGFKLSVQGKLTIENCEIHALGNSFLTILWDAAVSIKSTKFVIPPEPHCVICASDAVEFLLENCTFITDTAAPVPEVPNIPPLLGIPALRHLLPAVDVGQGRIVGCRFSDVVTEIRAREIIDAAFERCGAVCAGSADGDNQIARCTFTDCYAVTVEDGSLEDSGFAGLSTLYLVRTAAENCVFQRSEVERQALISMEDSTVSRCTFENILLKNDARFCDAIGDCSVEECRFSNCCAENCARDLFHGEETTGRFHRKAVNYSLVDEDSCSGLDEIREMDNNKI